MWIDDVALVALEEVDWAVAISGEEQKALMRDDDFLEKIRFDETWYESLAFE